MKRLALLGATGSIGQSTLKVVRAHPYRFSITSIAAGRNAELAISIIQEFHPSYVAMGDPETAERVKSSCPEVTVESGPRAVENAALHNDVDLVVAAIVGEAGLRSTYAAAKAGRPIALANKESLVMAGPLFTRLGVPLLPVDSEHAALHQALRSGKSSEVRRLVLTASGGPFRTRALDTFDSITVDEALAHPTWAMGPKITIDSATMVNKALEVIEAHFLFGVEPEYINVLIQPRSLVHAMVEFSDGTLLAQLSPNDMVYPIQYALTYPERLPTPPGYLDLSTLGSLEFLPPEPGRYPALALGYAALKMGESAPAVLSAANEEAVDAFLHRRISFPAISRVLEGVLSRHEPFGLSTLDDVTRAAAWARRTAREEIEQKF